MAKDLSIYLNDHHAGSIAALELIDHLIERYKQETWQEFFVPLRANISADQTVLEDIILVQNSHVGTIRQATAWVVEKIARVKIRLSDPGEIDLGLFIALEVLVIGITGKFYLWSQLDCICHEAASLRTYNFAELKTSAISQRDVVEAMRLTVGKEIFAQDLA